MDHSTSLSRAGDDLRNPGHMPGSGRLGGSSFAHIEGSSHGPKSPKRVAKTKSPDGAIVKKAAKGAAPGKKSAPKAGKAK